MRRSMPYLLAGGVAGAALRWAVAEILDSATAALLTVNTLGSLILGIAAAVPSVGPRYPANVRLGLTVGFCGGLTTFSGLLVEIVQRWKDEAGGTISLAGTSVILGLAAILVGQALGRRLHEAPR